MPRRLLAARHHRHVTATPLIITSYHHVPIEPLIITSYHHVPTTSLIITSYHHVTIEPLIITSYHHVTTTSLIITSYHHVTTTSLIINAQARAATPLIVDSDMSFDVDDVMAVCMAHALHDLGEVRTHCHTLPHTATHLTCSATYTIMYCYNTLAHCLCPRTTSCAARSSRRKPRSSRFCTRYNYP